MSQWVPTHVQCTITRARDLLIKGKGGQNDAFVTIQLNKEKFQTSVVKSGATAEWNEECDLPLSHNNDWLVLTVCHKNFFGVDEFLGRCELPLNEFDWNERPRARWFALRAKQGKKHQNKEHKLRGEVQIMLKFSAQNLALSTPDLANVKKHSSLASTLKHTIGASLRNLHKPGKNDASYPSPLSRYNANSKSNLSLAQGGDFSSARNSNLVSQTLPRNMGAAGVSGVFDSPNSGALRPRARSPSSVSQSAALASLGMQQREGKSRVFTGNEAAMRNINASNNNMPSPMLSRTNASASPTSLVDESFQESIKNVNAAYSNSDQVDSSHNDSTNRFTVSPVPVAARVTKTKTPAPPPPVLPAVPEKSSRRVPKVHKLAGGSAAAGNGSVVGNLLANSAANPFEEDDNSPSPAPQPRAATGLKPNSKSNSNLNVNISGNNNVNNRRSTGSSFYADGDSGNNTASNNRASLSPRQITAGNNNNMNNRSSNNGNDGDDDSRNPFSEYNDNNTSPNNNSSRPAVLVNGASSVAAAVLNRSISNRSSLVSGDQPNGTSSKAASLERNQQPPTSQFYANNNTSNNNGANMRNGGGAYMANGYGNNRISLPVSNLARVEATMHAALKPLTASKVPRDLELKYGHMERNDLLIRLAHLENDLESKDIEIDRMKSYLESLLSRVMEKCPELLHSSPE